MNTQEEGPGATGRMEAWNRKAPRGRCEGSCWAASGLCALQLQATEDLHCHASIVPLNSPTRSPRARAPRNARRGGGDSRLHGRAAPCPARAQCGRCHLGLAARDHQDSSLGLLDQRRANHAHQQPSLHAGSCDDCHTQRLPRLPRSGDGPRPRTGGAHRRRAAHGLAAGCGGARTLARRRLHASARRPPVDLGLEICLPAVPECGARAFHRLLDGRAQHRPAHVGDCLRRSERCAAARLHMHCTCTCACTRTRTAPVLVHAHALHDAPRVHCTCQARSCSRTTAARPTLATSSPSAPPPPPHSTSCA